MYKSNRKEEEDQGFEQVIEIKRVTKVTKGGKNFRFNCIIAVGDKDGSVGIGMAKANEVIPAINKAKEIAKKNLFKVPIRNGTIPHKIIGKYAGSKVMLKPAAQGTSVIAGGPVRAIMEAAGIENILTKSFGSNTKHNIAKATMSALKALRTHEEVAKLRGKTVAEILE
ncbi:MAG: 30S ribosomal protein S5 [Candidatus Cloacimonetes bacterium]|nr:30S ribosomal protein S5 [Candidatus Cloacimonadota bacterium]MBL7108595.1 30S ribosomal protein S5 [Candidatus Cloacimonadota bacterium]